MGANVWNVERSIATEALNFKGLLKEFENLLKTRYP